MRVWLAGFVLLFVGVELFEWFTQLGSVQASGMGLILGGMGLAAISNAGRWQKPVSGEEKSTNQQALNIETPTLQTPEIKAPAREAVDRSQDSISFKVRWPGR